MEQDLTILIEEFKKSINNFEQLLKSNKDNKIEIETSFKEVKEIREKILNIIKGLDNLLSDEERLNILKLSGNK